MKVNLSVFRISFHITKTELLHCHFLGNLFQTQLRCRAFSVGSFSRKSVKQNQATQASPGCEQYYNAIL